MGKPTTAPIDSYPCPHCNRRVDLSDYAEDELDEIEEGDWLTCPACKRHIIVQAVKPTTLITARSPNAGETPPRDNGGF